ncbi:zinc finger protein 853 [Drosophila takahashii]|uniref:zinc finger protein 853 n=1 Tax=Drosophila takahashii TaxID=29030 RepID=UPI001CF7FBDA|nr:sal-like protein 1 [Drosophila takahashii]XP_017015594.2 sal-like protein 1 [Drosophila takahashii]
MIGTEDMSAAAGMDISESFRAEDLSKADFFDFVTGPDMGIGIGVGVGVEALGVSLHQQQQHHQTHQQPPHSHNNNNSHVQVVHQPITSQSQQQSLCGGARTNSSMIHDGGGGGAGSGGGGVVVPVGNRNGTTNGGDPTLQGYEFWHQDKDNSRLDSSSIFEDLDRYCWQQQPVTASASNGGSASTNQPSPTSPQSHLQQQQQHQQQHQQQQHQQLQQQQQPNASSSSAASSGAGSSSDTISSLDTTDGQIYTLTVLNGGEPWLKRSEAEQLPTSLDLDSLLGSFPGYIKSEYPYDDSGFSTDGKDVIGNGTDGLSSISQAQNQGQQQTQQTLPSLVTAISLAGGNDLGQQLAQFQNNNNDWHMADHNAETEQSTAESLLRSALQGKGYVSKGLHMQNGLTGMPVVKDEDMRRLLFADEAAALGFVDSTLSAAQMFDEAQGIHLSAQQQQQQQQQQQHNGGSNILVDDMFLSLENAFSDDFEKIKRIANEVQQFCSAGSAGTPTPGDYGPPGDVLMQISPSAATVPLQPPQPLKPEVSTSTSPASTVVVSAVRGGGGSGGGGGGVTKPKKAYKRSSSNNNNPNVANNNPSSGSNPLIGGSGSGGSSSSSGSASSSSNSPPANSGGSSSSSSGGSAQRKERSLHYCSICSKGFKDKYSVNVHIRTHTGEKPFACSLCGKSFRQKAHLAKHYQTHMTQKNNGNLIKGGGSGKHPRSSGSTGGSLNQRQQQQQQQQQLGGGGVVPPSLPVMISNPNTPPSGILPPANGLLANR